MTDIVNNTSADLLKTLLTQNPSLMKELGLQKRNTGRKIKDKNVLEVPKEMNIPDELKPSQAKLVEEMVKPKTRAKRVLNDEQKQQLVERLQKAREVKNKNQQEKKQIKQEEKINSTKTIKIKRNIKKEKEIVEQDESSDEEDEVIQKVKSKVNKKKEIIQEIDKQIASLPTITNTSRYGRYLQNW
tara:strand:- start:1412 stop:1969 length:558 start_codon:yes stop_codon:yes gene_type:complete